MKAITMILAGGFGLAAFATAVPAAAQYYPGYPAPAPSYGYPGYGYQNNNVVGQVLGQILGYGRYPYGNYGYQQYGGQSMAVDQCALAEGRFTLLAPDDYRGDTLDVKVFDAAGRELARESLYAEDDEDG